MTLSSDNVAMTAQEIVQHAFPKSVWLLEHDGSLMLSSMAVIALFVFLCEFSDKTLPRWRRVVDSLAGAAVGFFLGGAVLLSASTTQFSENLGDLRTVLDGNLRVTREVKSGTFVLTLPDRQLGTEVVGSRTIETREAGFAVKLSESEWGAIRAAMEKGSPEKLAMVEGR